MATLFGMAGAGTEAEFSSAELCWKGTEESFPVLHCATILEEAAKPLYMQPILFHTYTNISCLYFMAASASQ